MVREVLASNIKGLALMQTRALVKANKGRRKKVTMDEFINELSEYYAKNGLKALKKWMRENDFTESQINKMVVYDPDRKSVYIRGSVQDIMDYEFYGVPQGTFPNVKRLRKWVTYRVIRRDPGLQREYSQLSRTGKKRMIKDLTYKFGYSIMEHGLKRYSTTDPNDILTPRQEKKYGKFDPIIVRWSSANQRGYRKVVIPKYRKVSDKV